MPFDPASYPLTTKTNNATSGTVAVWTPSAGTRFRLLGGQIFVSADAAISGGAALLKAYLEDSAVLIPGTYGEVMVPATAGTGELVVIEFAFPGLGIASAAVGDVLNLVLNQTLTSGDVRCDVWGYETP